MDSQLEPLVDQYTSVITDMESARNVLSSDVSSRHDIEAAILTLIGDLRAHFSIEESSKGVFATLLRESPRAAEPVEGFRREHEQLRGDATRLEQLVNRQELDEPTWRTEVLRAVGDLTQRFLEHERSEDRWLISNVPVKK